MRIFRRRRFVDACLIFRQTRAVRDYDLTGKTAEISFDERTANDLSLLFSDVTSRENMTDAQWSLRDDELNLENHVRETVWRDKRYAMGHAWTDPHYA